MTTAAATLNTRDPFMPRRPPGMRSGLALALLAHALLVAGLAYSVDWHASTPEAVEAELWSALPQQAAPRAVAPPPAPAPSPAPPPPPAPAPKPQPVQPPPPPQVDPQIAIEKAREVKRVQQEELAEQERARRDKTRRDQAKQEQDRKLAEQRQQARDEALQKKQAEKQLADQQQADQAKAEKAEAAQREKDRLAQIKRMQGLAGASGDSNATGSALRSSGPSASYGGRVVARIKPNIVFPDAVDGNPMATVEVRVAPDGSIVGRRLLQSSGVKAWDDAVLRAIDRTDGLPRDIDGRVPPVLEIKFRPRDL